MPMPVRKMQLKKFPFVKESFFKSLLIVIYTYYLKHLKQKSWIYVDDNKGRIMMGTTDETATLEYGQVFVSYTDFKDSTKIVILKQEVVCAKNPCFHPGDLRKFTAVDVPALHHMKDCVVFPQNGERPHPDEMSGSDLDGDMYFVCWDDDLIPSNQNEKPMDYIKPKNHIEYEINQQSITKFIGKFIQNDQLGVIANAHVVHADREGIKSEKCIKLSKMHSDAVDFPKTECVAKIEPDLKPEEYPDFMGKQDKPTYKSNKILGKLYRQCSALKQNVTYEHTAFLDTYAFQIKGFEKYLAEGIMQRDMYKDELKKLMDLYNISSEMEVISGQILSPLEKKGHLRNEQYEINKIIQTKYKMIFLEYEQKFYEEFGGKDRCNDGNSKRAMLEKASAWYVVTYDDRYNNVVSPTISSQSFPWIVGDLLAELREINMKCEEKNTFTSLDESLTLYFKQTNQKRIECLSLLKETELLIIKDIMSAFERKQFMFSEETFIKDKLLVQDLCFYRELSIKLGICHPNIDNVKKLRMFLSFAFPSKHINDLSIVYSVYGVPVNIQFYTARSITSQTLLEDLNKRLVTQYLIDWLNFERCIGARRIFRDNESFVAFLVKLVYNKCNMESSSNGKLLLNTLETLSDVSSSELQNNKRLPMFKQKIFQLYSNISISNKLEFFHKSKITDNVYLKLNLPLEIWGSLRLSEIYTARMLSLSTGAEVSIRNTFFHGTRGFCLEAFGNELQLKHLEECLFNLQESSHQWSITGTRSNHFINDMYQTVFTGQLSDESVLQLKPHTKDFNPEHKHRSIFSPSFSNVNNSEYALESFMKGFQSTLKKTRENYESNIHGNMDVSIKFGYFYFYDLSKTEMTISEFKNEANKKIFLVQKKRRSRIRREVLRNFRTSFVPSSLDLEKLEFFLKSKNIECLSTSELYKVTMQFDEKFFKKGEQYPLATFNQNLEFVRFSLPEYKWLVMDICRGINAEEEKNLDVRLKLKSTCIVDSKTLKNFPNVSDLLDPTCPVLSQNNGILSVNKKYNNKIKFVKHQVRQIFTCKNEKDKTTVWQGIIVEISKTKEYEVVKESNRLNHVRDFNEVGIKPMFPGIEADDDIFQDVIRQYWDLIVEILEHVES